jgi:hypothetical protein
VRRPACAFKAFFPSAGERRASFLLRPSLVDGAAGGKWQKVAHRSDPSPFVGPLWGGWHIVSGANDVTGGVLQRVRR